MCEPKEWTLMFYFASDNPLAISAVSQLKAIKDAGFHPDVNVVAQFDPYTEGTPTHVFDVNVVNKLKASGRANIGFSGNDPTVRSLIEDKLWRDEQTSSPPVATAGATTSNPELVRNALNRVLRETHNINYKPPVAPDVKDDFYPRGDRTEEPGAQTSLRGFLRFCADKYPARHYMLFMLGHGVVVGNDIFMLDEHASENSLTLIDLGQILAEFKHTIELEESTFELVSFHSCSVSSIEVAHELQGTAKYMLASQGPAFVGSWPYRQILVRIFNSVSDKASINMRDLMVEIHRSCMLNSADYLLAGYSFQLTLCDLDKVSTIKDAVNELARALTAGLTSDQSTELSVDSILLSHWKSQSFFNEMYTDLYDFCFCLSNKIKELEAAGKSSTELTDIYQACGKVMDMLVKETPRREGQSNAQQIIIASDSLGPAFQYSRGLSVYFPWSEPSKDSHIMAQYERYRFSSEIKNPWVGFLREYFKDTKRTVSNDEPDERRFLPAVPVNGPMIIDRGLDEDIASLIYNGEGMPDLRAALGGGLKSDPTDKTGGDHEALSIKNYPRDIRTRRTRQRQAAPTFPITQTFGLMEQYGRNGRNGNNSKKSAV
ncbi:MAG TPA: clostripain-related cysteine peptidase [Pyrinomonadaceae bacterium]